jgi:uncharacterized coiled-coil protein SlyX
LVTAEASESEQRCLDCPKKDEAIARVNMDSQQKEKTIARHEDTIARQEDTIARLNATIKTLTGNMNEPSGPSHTFPSPSNIAGPSYNTSGAYAQTILPWANQFESLSQEPPDPTLEASRSVFTAPSSNAHQAGQPGSFTQPSFQGTSLTYPSQHETPTETSEAVGETNAESTTPKALETDDPVVDDYGLPPFDGDSAIYQMGGQFDWFGEASADFFFM